MHVRTLVTEDGRVICEHCQLAMNAFTRMRGLLGRTSLGREEGLLLEPASSVHTAFMRFPIDVVFLDRDLVVLRIVSRLTPWRTAARRRSHAVLELAAGECARRGLREGERLGFT
jgi:uncharacterized membrane protein (UPF0127 family)